MPVKHDTDTLPVKQPPVKYKQPPPIFPGPQVPSLDSHLHELAIDMEIWNRAEYFTYDSLITSLLQGVPIPGMTRGPDPFATSPSAQASPTVQGLALGFDHVRTLFNSVHIMPCKWISEDAVTLAGAVLAGLFSIVDEVNRLGGGKGNTSPYVMGMWGWRVAIHWCGHIQRREIVFGPMAAWHWLNHWHFILNTKNEILPYKLVDPGPVTGPWCKESIQPIIPTCSCLCYALLCQGSTTRAVQ